MNNTRRYIKEQLKKGVSEHDILEALKESGHEPTAAQNAIQETQKSIKRLHRVIVALAALLAIAIVLLIATNTQTQPTTTPQETIDPEAILQEAIETGDSSLCAQLEGDQRAFCEQETQEQEPRTLSLEEEILQEAIETGDSSLCAQLEGDQRMFCEQETQEQEPRTLSLEEEILQEAIETGDSSLCAQLEDENQRTFCEEETQ